MSQLSKNSKLKELILYAAKRSYDDPFYGATKLNKVLFFSDFLAFKTLGQSITGHSYRKLEHGPAPAKFTEVRDEMIREGAAALQHTELNGLRQDRLIHLRDPILTSFSGDEIAIVDEMIALLRNKSATDISEFSHRFIGWEIASMGEDIPYETVFISRREPTDFELAHADSLTPKLPDAVR